jgi:hypothetical protein
MSVKESSKNCGGPVFTNIARKELSSPQRTLKAINNGRLGCRPFQEIGAPSFMATKTHVVIFKEAMDRNAQPEIFTCSAAEGNEIEELLATVENEGSGPIGSLSYTKFVEQVQPITLAELRERFAEELEAAELEAAEQEEA